MPAPGTIDVRAVRRHFLFPGRGRIALNNLSPLPAYHPPAYHPPAGRPPRTTAAPSQP